jgi:pimeloyl-ACP methyl ester carboxylesterase
VRRRKLLLAGTAFIVCLFVFYFAVACGLQRRILFPAPETPASAPTLPTGTEIVWLGNDADIEAWFIRPPAVEHATPVLIFFHGNGELIDYWVHRFKEHSRSGVGVLLVEYPGYGRSGGKTTQETITQASIAAYDFLAGKSDVDAEAIVAHGRSLGGGAATQLALARPISALVLESTFTDVRAMSSRLGFPGSWVADPFDNLAAVAQLEVPVLVLHGQRDTLVPVAHGEALAEASETELIRMPCGHNDCPSSWPVVEGFMAEHGLLRH